MDLNILEQSVQKIKDLRIASSLKEAIDKKRDIYMELYLIFNDRQKLEWLYKRLEIKNYTFSNTEYNLRQYMLNTLCIPLDKIIKQEQEKINNQKKEFLK